MEDVVNLEVLDVRVVTKILSSISFIELHLIETKMKKTQGKNKNIFMEYSFRLKYNKYLEISADELIEVLTDKFLDKETGEFNKNCKIQKEISVKITKLQEFILNIKQFFTSPSSFFLYRKIYLQEVFKNTNKGVNNE